ncbi:MAG: tRNA1(Val) (adenine(37)-N6)-methyltransferase, partial [Desulfocapsaceae bacterium]
SFKMQVSQDSLFDGRLVCKQHRSGYRFSIDSVLLAHFPEIKKDEKILDIGTGCGIIGLIFCYRYAKLKIFVTGVELQPELADLARLNIDTNGYLNNFSLIEGNLHDFRSMIKAESFSLVTANPPFYAKGTGRVSNNPEAMTARHQDDGGLAVFVESAYFSVKNRGKIIFIYPAELAAELLFCFKTHRISPKKIQFIYSYPGTKNASLVIVEGIKNGGTGMEVLTPLYIYQYRNGPYSKTVQAMFQGQSHHH